MTDSEKLDDALHQLSQLRTVLGKFIALTTRMQCGTWKLDIKRDLGVDPRDWQESVVVPPTIEV